MLWRDTPGDHRAPHVRRPDHPPAGLRPAVRLALGVAAVLVTGGLGVFTAEVVGLTGAPPSAAVERPTPQFGAESPSFNRTIDLDATPSPPAEKSPSTAAAATANSAAAPEPVSTTEPAPEPAPAPVPTVKLGGSCATEGANGLTANGKQAVCVGQGNGRTRWRRA